MNYFKDAKVGDQVWDYVWDKGKISEVTGKSLFVEFSNSVGIRYDINGIAETEQAQRLFYYNNRPIVITQDDLELNDDVDKYYLSEHGIKQQLGEMREWGAYYTAKVNIKNPEEYTRKVHRETHELKTDHLAQALYDGYVLNNLKQPYKDAVDRLLQDNKELRKEIEDIKNDPH